MHYQLAQGAFVCRGKRGGSSCIAPYPPAQRQQSPLVIQPRDSESVGFSSQAGQTQSGGRQVHLNSVRSHGP